MRPAESLPGLGICVILTSATAVGSPSVTSFKSREGEERNLEFQVTSVHTSSREVSVARKDKNVVWRDVGGSQALGLARKGRIQGEEEALRREPEGADASWMASRMDHVMGQRPRS